MGTGSRCDTGVAPQPGDHAAAVRVLQRAAQPGGGAGGEPSRRHQVSGGLVLVGVGLVDLFLAD